MFDLVEIELTRVRKMAEHADDPLLTLTWQSSRRTRRRALPPFVLKRFFRKNPAHYNGIDEGKIFRGRLLYLARRC